MSKENGLRSVCLVLGIQGAKRQKDKALAGLLIENGKELTAEQVRIKLHNAEMQGFEVLPCCDNHDERGYCKGHEITAKSICLDCAKNIDHEKSFWSSSVGTVWGCCQTCGKDKSLKELELSDKTWDELKNSLH